MRPSFKAYLKKDKQLSNGEYPVYLGITYNRESRFIHLGFSVPEKDWNTQKGNVRRSNYNYGIFNKIIDRERDKTIKMFYELLERKDEQNLTVKEVYHALRRGGGIAFTDFFKEKLDRFDENGQYREWKNGRVIRNKLIEFNNDQAVKFSDLTVNFIERFKVFLKNKKRNSSYTIYSNLKILRRYINYAVKEGLIAEKQNPFKQIKLKKPPTEKTKLTMDQIKAIADLELTGGTRQDHSRDAFIFSFFTAGIRIGDLLQLQWKNIEDKWLRYTMDKTQKPKQIPLIPQAIQILKKYESEATLGDDYIFPFLDSNRDYSDIKFLKKQIESKTTTINKHLKTIAGKAGIKENISFHISRHSFADYARKSKMNLYDISKALGHSDLETTEGYLKSFDEDGLEDELTRIFE